MKLLTALLALSLSILAFANEVEDVEYEEGIDVHGSFERKSVSASERTRIFRKKLEKQTELLVQKKMEQIRLQQEIKLQKQLEAKFKLLNNNLNSQLN